MNRIPAKILPVYGRRIQRERHRKGWTLRQLVKASGMSTSTVARLESGQDASLSTFLAVAAALEVPASVLLADPSCWLCDGSPPPGMICSECDPRVNGRQEES